MYVEICTCPFDSMMCRLPHCVTEVIAQMRECFTAPWSWRFFCSKELS